MQQYRSTAEIDEEGDESLAETHKVDAAEVEVKAAASGGGGRNWEHDDR